MEVDQILELKPGTPVRVHNRTRLDHAFEGRTGEFVNVTKPHGFARLHLDGDFEGQNVLVHPESIEAVL